MNYNKKSVTDIDVSGKKILLRCDFNVPLDKESGAITDEGRITASLPTITYLLDNGAAVIVCSHLGRPDGEWKPKLSLKVVADRLSGLLGKPVIMAEDVAGEDARQRAATLRAGEILMLENLRFHKEEEKNDPSFARALADMADIYVDDAFGTAHRAHASTEGVSRYLPAVSGFLIAKELRYIGGALQNPKRPFIAILGGSKVSDKLGVIINLLSKVDALLIGGGMAFTFIKACGGSIGKSLCEEDKLDYALDVLEKAKKQGVRILLPVDAVAAAAFSNDAEAVIVDSTAIPDNMLGLDIGPETSRAFADEIRNAATVIWNGPMGVFEMPKFAEGTSVVAYALADSGAISIVGGGDSAAAIRKFGLEDKVTHVSTGGGATLEFMEGIELPGIACLLDK
ncbi:MAG: phosphoglycerate kinase [Clostridiales bacterium]|nr:phosphoglycerate kinase [Clostridiales bacterium]